MQTEWGDLQEGVEKDGCNKWSLIRVRPSLFDTRSDCVTGVFVSFKGKHHVGICHAQVSKRHEDFVQATESGLRDICCNREWLQVVSDTGEQSVQQRTDREYDYMVSELQNLGSTIAAIIRSALFFAAAFPVIMCEPSLD